MYEYTYTYTHAENKSLHNLTHLHAYIQQCIQLLASVCIYWPSTIRPICLNWSLSLSHIPYTPISVPQTFSSPSSCSLATGSRGFQTGKGNSTGTLSDVHPTISNHNVPCTTRKPVMKNVTVLGGQKVIEFDQDSPEAEITFALT